MSEIKKLYENAEVKKQIPKVCSSNELYCKECEAHIEDAMPYCKNAEYPPFTPVKQLELIKWLCDTDYYITEFCRLIDTREYYIETDYKHFQSSSFEETLAGLINSLWQDLTDTEQEQIRNILNEK